jgi:hypothetical protein
MFTAHQRNLCHHGTRGKSALLTLLLAVATTHAREEGPILDAAPPPQPVTAAGPPADDDVRRAAELLTTFARGEALKPEDWAFICVNAGRHPTIKSFAADADPFPAAVMVSLLEDTRLAVRLGALELLENIGGESLGFDPWEPRSPVSLSALGLWRQWAPLVKPRRQAGGLGNHISRLLPDASDSSRPADGPLTAEKFRGYLADIVSGDA